MPVPSRPTPRAKVHLLFAAAFAICAATHGPVVARPAFIIAPVIEGAALEALQLHRRLGARFVSPYYLSIASGRGEQSKSAIKAMEVRPNNKLEGSDMLYQAIRELASQ